MPTCLSERVLWIGLGMLPMCTGWHGTMQIGGGLSHLEAPKSQPTLGRIKIFPDWSANMFLCKDYRSD